MGQLIQAIRGMNDCMPEETEQWQYVERTLTTLAARYGYQEVRFPIVEKTELFKRTIGEVTDIVEKEMYTFLDRNQDSLTLRPEGTACCVRALLEHGRLAQQIQKVWYMGPMFRHERPQHGRYRQFHQFGMEAFGLNGPDIDAELLMLTARLWQELGLADVVSLQINSLGTAEDRQRYKQVLIDYLTKNIDSLDTESKHRLHTNPLRILDSKNKDLQSVIAGAPQLLEFINQEALDHFTQLKQLLREIGLSFTINQCLVRGLDYYAKTVFEWQTDLLGSQNAICAGGRYDSLVEQIGGHPTPAVGFAIGIERIIALKQQIQTSSVKPQADLYVLGSAPNLLIISEQLRQALPSLRIMQHCGGGSFKSQFKRADRSGARFAIILGEEEIAQGLLGFKDLRNDASQETLSMAIVIEKLTQWQLRS